MILERCSLHLLTSVISSRSARSLGATLTPAIPGRGLLAALAKEQNPVLGYWDPVGLANLDLWGQGEDASIGAHRLPSPPPSSSPACGEVPSPERS